MKLGTITAPDGTSILVELITRDDLPSYGIEDLPEGAVPTGVADDVEDAIGRLNKTIRSVVNVGRDALLEHGPDEWKVEFEIGFAGKTSPIPVLVSSEAKAVLKITATWKKE
ncbi:MAG TPA: CU044_2847 family protein [Rhodopseudomonas sp.]|uniref:CU044_2847 family protein n=1 Tax=Rhodopseudomonas sp. TaxID=1078 RepID=UPI002ED91CB9